MSVADIEELEILDASEVHARRLDAKEVITPKGTESLLFKIADLEAELLGGDLVLRTSTLIREQPERCEEQGVLAGESDGSQP